MSEKENAPSDLSSSFTDNIPEILKKLNISLLVSTYQRGKVIVVRQESDKVNTHFTNFNRPMGIAVKPNRISVGCFNSVENFQNIPDLIPRLEEPDKHDACYVPRVTVETGEIDIHEMAWGEKNNLWFINTKFSCLCTLHAEYSFYPQWRPHFISGLLPQDRCHLNGMAM
ncbi:MAG: DUF4915 domain-containing protein, partial [Candidatus Marinimicrobia bacterium]|nr:DUF4915 domain-containing protein [Candidatus Neomarinimicrobiota bacterium]